MSGEQLELFEGGPRCTCGAELVAHINHFRGLCDRCILQKTREGFRWNEDPDLKRASLMRWLAQQPKTKE